MPIAKKPQRSTAASGQGGDRAAEAFISAAGKPDTSEEVAKSRKTPVMIRFDRALLERVDTAAKRRGISRSAWIQFTVSRALDTGEG
jgi:predicted HicB family RNase H-like nuclease